MSVLLANHERDDKSIIAGTSFNNPLGNDFTFLQNEDSSDLIDSAILASFGILTESNQPFAISPIQGHSQGHRQKEKDIENTDSFSSEETTTSVVTNDSLDSALTGSSALTGTTSTTVSSVTVLDGQHNEDAHTVENSTSPKYPAKSSLRKRFSQPLPMLVQVKDSPMAIPSPTRKAPPKSLDLSRVTAIPTPTLDRLPSIFLTCPTPTGTPPPTPPPHAPQLVRRLPKRNSLADETDSQSSVRLIFKPEERDQAALQKKQKEKAKQQQKQSDGDNTSLAGSRRSVSSLGSAFKRFGLAIKKLPFGKGDRSVEGQGEGHSSRSTSYSEGFKAPPPMKRRASFFNPRPLPVIDNEHQGTSQSGSSDAETRQRKRASTVGRQSGNRLNPMSVPTTRRRDRTLSNASLDGVVAEILKNDTEQVDEAGQYNSERRTLDEQPPIPDLPSNVQT